MRKLYDDHYLLIALVHFAAFLIIMAALAVG